MRISRESSAHIPSSYQLAGRGRTVVPLSHHIDNKAHHRLLRRVRATETNGRRGGCVERPDPACAQRILEIFKGGLGRITGQRSSMDVFPSSTWTSPSPDVLSSVDPTKSRGDNTASCNSYCNDTGVARLSTQLIPPTPAAGGNVVVRYVASWFDACCSRLWTRSSLLAVPVTEDGTSKNSSPHPEIPSTVSAENSLEKTRTSAGDASNSTNPHFSVRNTLIPPQIHSTPAGILLTSDGADGGTERRRVVEQGVHFSDLVRISGSEQDVSRVDHSTGKQRGQSAGGGGVGTSESCSTTWQEALETFAEDPKHRCA